MLQRPELAVSIHDQKIMHHTSKKAICHVIWCNIRSHVFLFAQNITYLLHRRHRRSEPIYHQASGVAHFCDQRPQGSAFTFDHNVVQSSLDITNVGVTIYWLCWTPAEIIVRKCACCMHWWRTWPNVQWIYQISQRRSTSTSGACVRLFRSIVAFCSEAESACNWLSPGLLHMMCLQHPQSIAVWTVDYVAYFTCRHFSFPLVAYLHICVYRSAESQCCVLWSQH